MTTAADLIAETRRHLLAGGREEMNKLSLSTDASQSEFSFTYDMGGIQRGSVVAVDMELVYVWAASTTAKTATVERGYLGTTPATHAQDALVTVNPRWPSFWILDALNAEIVSYASPTHGLYQIKNLTLTYVATTDGYDLAADVQEVYEARWLDIGNNWRRLKSYTVVRDAGFASGVGLILYDYPYTSGATIRVRYKAPFDPLVTVADDVLTTTGLHVEAHDIPPLGAAARLVAGREVRRAQQDAAPEPRAAQEVPPGAATGAARALLDLRNRRLAEEASRLHSMYPTQSRSVA